MAVFNSYGESLFIFRNDFAETFGYVLWQGNSCYTEQVFFEVLLYIGHRSVENFFALIDQYDLVADFLYLFHPVGAENNGCPVFGEAENLILDQIGIHRIETAEWFVEYDEFRVMHDRYYKLQFLRHALAQVFNFFIPPGLHFKTGEPVFGLAVGFAG